jgi:hypothetical protein
LGLLIGYGAFDGSADVKFLFTFGASQFYYSGVWGVGQG